MSFHVVLPILSGLLTTFIFFCALQYSSHRRILFAPVLVGSAIVSLLTSSRLNTLPSFSFFWVLAICIITHHALSILYIEPKYVPQVYGEHLWILTYKIWNDPQGCVDWNTVDPRCHITCREPLDKIRKAIMVLRLLVRVAINWFLWLCVSGAFVIFLQPTASDFAPPRLVYFRRILCKSCGPLVSSRDTLLRLFVSTFWMWDTFTFLTTFHALFNIIFVVILGVDEPEEWVLFGDLRQAYGLRRFWGKFWHKLATPASASSGRLVARSVFGFLPHSTFERWFIPFWTFLVSGLFHEVARAVTNQQWSGSMIDLKFFLVNFVACGIESLTLGLIKKMCMKNERGVLCWISRSPCITKLVGFTWTGAFFFWSAPRWQYPTLYEKLLKIAL